MEHIFYWDTCYSTVAAACFITPIVVVIIQGIVFVLYRWKVIGDEGGVSSAACESFRKLGHFPC